MELHSTDEKKDVGARGVERGDVCGYEG